MHCRFNIDTVRYYNGTVPRWVTKNKIAGGQAGRWAGRQAGRQAKHSPD